MDNSKSNAFEEARKKAEARHAKNMETPKSSAFEEARKQAQERARKSQASMVDQAYIDDYFTQANKFLTGYGGEEGHKRWAEKGSNYQSGYDEWKALSERGAIIETWLEMNKDSFDPESANEFRESLKRSRQDLSEALGQSYFNDFYSRSNSFLDGYDQDAGLNRWSTADADYQGRYDEWKDLDQRRAWIENWMGENPGVYTADIEQGLSDSMKEYRRYLSMRLGDYHDLKANYNLFDTEDEYNAYLEAEKLRQQMMGEDLGLLEKEIQELENQRDSYEYDWTDNQQRKAAEEHIEEYNKQISAKRQYYNKAKLLQEGAAMAGVVNNDDFQEYSGYASTESGKWYDFITTEKGMGYNDLTYEYINNQNGIREEIDRRFTAQDGATIGGSDSKFEYRSLAYMTAEEVAIYNYYYAKNGKEAAEKYLDTIQEDLNTRKAYDIREELKGHTASQILHGYAAGWDQFDSGLKSLFNTESDYIPTSYVQLASGMIREDLGQAGPKLPQWLGGASLGQIGYDAVNTTSHMLPSILASSVSNVLVPGSGAYVGNALTFASSAGNSYQEALNAGYSKEQARSYSTLVGASEAGLQYFLGGISKLGGKVSGSAISKMMSGIDSALGKAALQLTGSMLSEGMEEGLQEIMTTWFKNLTLHAGEDINWEEVAYSSLMGMLTSGIMEIGGSTLNKVVSKGQGTQSREGSAPVEADGVQQRTDGVDVAHTPGREAPVSLYDDAAVNETSRQEPAVQETAAEDPLWALAQEVAADQREAENARQKDLDGAETAADAREDVGYVQEQTQSEGIYEAVEDAPTVQGQQTAEAASDPVWEAAHTVARETRQQQEAPTEEQLTDAQPETVPQTKAAEKERLIYGKYTGIREIQRGKVLLDLFNGDVNDSSKMDPNWHEEFNACKLLSRIREHIDIDTGNQLLGKLAEHRYAVEGASVRGMEQAYNYGYAGYDRSAMEGKNTMAALVPEDVRNILYDMGAQYRQTVDAGKAKGKTKPAPKPKTVNVKADQNIKPVREDSGKHRGPDVSRYKNVQFEGDITRWGKKQQAEVEFVDFIAKNFSGNQVHVYESYKNADGKYVYTDSLGRVHAAPNGKYVDGNGDIYLDLNAGNRAEGLVMNTFAHELYHHVEKQAPEQAKALAEFIAKELGEENVEAAVNRQIEKARKAGYGEGFFEEQGMSAEEARQTVRDRAYSDFIADGLETMFTKGDVVEKLADLHRQDKGLFHTIRKFIRKWVSKLREFYNAGNTLSIEGRQVAELETFDKIQQMFAEALKVAGENYRVAENIGVEIDGGTGSVTSFDLFSERTWTESDYVQEREKAAKEIAEAIGVSVKKAKDYIDSVNSIAKMIAEDRCRLDYFSSPNRSSFVGNVEYGGSFDFSTLCKKRRLLTGTFTAIQKALPNTALTANEILDIRNRMKNAGLEVSCGLCYVEGSRANMGQFAKEFLRLYKQYYPDAWQPNMADVNTPDGIEWVRINHPECYEQYEYFWNHYGTLKDGDKNLFASQQKPKLYQLHTEYKGEILQKFKGDDNVEEKNLNGGIRLQSFSDFEIVHLIDTMQIIMDMSRVGLAGQAYTKVPDFAWALGDTGIKINLSLIAKGVDASGNLIFDDIEGMPIAEAMKLRNRYSANVGTILVAFNDAQLMAAMKDDRVDFIIPFHRSQWKKSRYEAMGLPAKTKDYTFMQNEKFIKPQYHEYRGRMVKDKATNYMPNEYWDFSKSGKENAIAYLEMCARNNKRPKFYKILQNNGDGSYSLKADGSTDGYWKLLIDFKMYDNSGMGSPQMPVKPNFNMVEATRMLDEYRGGHSTFPVAQGIVDEFVAEYRDKHKVTSSNVVDATEVKHSARDSESVSNRSLLANALDSVAQDESEKRLLEEYREAIGKLEGYEKHLAELKEQIRELSFGKGPRDMAKIRALKDEAIKTSNRIGIYDKKLLRLEGTKTLERLLTRETEKARKQGLDAYRQKAQKKYQQTRDALKQQQSDNALMEKEYNRLLREYEAADEKVKNLQESRKKNVDGRHKTQVRHEIQKTAGELKKLFARGKDARNVKQEMRDMVAKSLELAEKLFDPSLSDENLLRSGVEVVMTAQMAQRFREGQELMAQLDAMSTKDPQRPKLLHQLGKIKSDLEDVFSAERERINGTAVSDLMDGICNAYQELQHSDKDYIRAAYNPEDLAYLQGIKENLGAVRAVDMDLKQLQELSKAYRMVLGTIRSANTHFVDGYKETVEQTAKQLMRELSDRRTVGKVRKALRDWMDARGWDYEKPFYALDRIGSETLKRLYQGLMDAENITHRDVMEAKTEQMRLVEKYGYNTWKVDRKMPQEFVDNTGKSFRMTLGEVMSLYAYSRRDVAQKHIEVGGFTLKQKSGDAVTYKLTQEQCQGITDLLTKEQKAFVEEMQTFLSQNMGAKGNEVSMKIRGIELFGEENYFPIHTDKRFMATAQEAKAKEEAGFGSLSNAGFTKATNKNAVAPMAIDPFMTVWADHVNEMSRYHGAVPALEDIRRVMNYSRYNDAEADSMSVKAALENAYGKKAVQYLDALYREANSGAVTDRLDMENTSRRMLSRFRKNAVAYSASVVIQQPGSLGKAFAMIDKKYFGGVRGMGTLIGGVAKTVSNPLTKVQNKAYAEMLKYAPGVTLAKEIGGFDTTGGSSIRSYLLDTERGFRDTLRAGTGKEKAGLLLGVVDDNPIANLPNVADKLAWIEIWNACKRETLAKNTDLVPGSEAALEKAGERFTEVIRATQVYDSMFAKSPMLKSKSLAMQYVVSFMNEPNTTANLVESALRDARKGQWGQATKKVTAVVRSTILTCVLKSLIYAMRDEDEDETYIEKYIASLTDNLLSDINVFTYFPVTKEIWGLSQGSDIERPDTAVLNDALTALVNVYNSTFKDVSDLSEEELAEWDKKCIQANWKLVDSVAAFFGIPVKNIRREVNAVLDHAAIAAKNRGMTSWIGVEQAVRQGIAEASPIIVNQDLGSKTDRLYQAVMAGDKAYEARLKGSYKDDDAYNAALRKALRDNDPRIRQAAEARMTGDFATYEKLLHEVKDEGKFGFDPIMEAINSEENALKRKNREEGPQEKTTEPEYEAIYDVDDYFLAIRKGDIAYQKRIFDALVAEKVDGGDLTHEAETQIASALVTRIGKAYMSEEISAAQALAMLEDHTEKGESQIKIWDFELEHNFPWSARVRKYRRGDLSEQDLMDAVMDIEGATAQEAREYIQFLDLEKQYPDIDITAANAAKYFEDAKPRGISVERFMDYVHVEDKYLAGEITASTAQKLIMEVGEMDEEDARCQVLVYDWKNDGYEGVTLAAVREYEEYCAASQVPRDAYLRIRKIKNNTENDVDENGKTVRYSAVKKVMEQIGKLNISDAQKEAIAKSMGWADSTIRKYKTW